MHTRVTCPTQPSLKVQCDEAGIDDECDKDGRVTLVSVSRVTGGRGRRGLARAPMNSLGGQLALARQLGLVGQRLERDPVVSRCTVGESLTTDKVTSALQR